MKMHTRRKKSALYFEKKKKIQKPYIKFPPFGLVF